MSKRLLKVTVNGRARQDLVPENMLLLDYLRDFVGLTGTKQGCDGGECGACTVLVDDKPVLSCLTLAASVEGRKVDTVESLALARSGFNLSESYPEGKILQVRFDPYNPECSKLT